MRDTDDALGLELWRAIANIRAWAVDAGKGRQRLFPGGRRSEGITERRAYARALAPELVPALEVFADLTDRPKSATAQRLVGACRQVVKWADARGLAETAVQFAEAAAAVDPGSAILANICGRVCRVAGHRTRAQLWYDRAIGLARQSQDVRQYVRGHLGYGNLLRDVGEHEAALPWIRRAGLTAKRSGLRGQAAEALHDAFTIELLREDYERAVALAQRSLTVYPRHHKRFPYLAADFAGLLVRCGAFRPALLLLEALQRRLTSPAEQLQLQGLIAWAAGGAHRAPRFEKAAEHVVAMASAYAHVAPGALYYAAEGARQLAEWEEAHRLAQLAALAADESEDSVTLSLARRLGDEVRVRRVGTPELTEEEPGAEPLWTMLPDVRARLVAWRGPSWRPRRRQDRPEDNDG